MQENCLFGSEGGAKLSFVPTPIQFRPRWRSNSLQINRFYHQFLRSGRHSYFVPRVPLRSTSGL